MLSQPTVIVNPLASLDIGGGINESINLDSEIDLLADEDDEPTSQTNDNSQLLDVSQNSMQNKSSLSMSKNDPNANTEKSELQ